MRQTERTRQNNGLKKNRSRMIYCLRPSLVKGQLIGPAKESLGKGRECCTSGLPSRWAENQIFKTKLSTMS
ncbi:hypothetical protein BgiMline_002560 [Biomphalaria glabrata]|nr:hypothetical protein BgiMline_011164 [Biomphalaria glabrata]